MEAKPKVLIIYTGGTIGMIKDQTTGELSNVDFNLISHHVPEINRLNIDLESVSFDKPVDSSEINIEHWQDIAKTVFDNYLQYDGFVVLHGSDTMAYTASALSYMFSGLQKPVILTGSQLPIGVIRTDGKENLITALEIAAAKRENGKSLITEVAVYFDYKLLRGNKCTKDSAEHFEAFRSPNYDELAAAGVNLHYNFEKLYRCKKEELSINLNLNKRVALIKLFPGIDFGLYAGVFDKKNVDGIVLETFGAGNAPHDLTLFNSIESFIENGGVVLNITQCNSGSVAQGLYKTSSAFNRLGVLSGKNLTTEAAITKMMICIDQNDIESSKEMLLKNLRGELD
jgi:L-asparaginase